jgi:hypothetical protein
VIFCRGKTAKSIGMRGFGRSIVRRYCSSKARSGQAHAPRFPLLLISNLYGRKPKQNLIASSTKEQRIDELPTTRRRGPGKHAIMTLGAPSRTPDTRLLTHRKPLLVSLGNTPPQLVSSNLKISPRIPFSVSLSRRLHGVSRSLSLATLSF